MSSLQASLFRSMDASVIDIAEKMKAGGRLSEGEALYLLQNTQIEELTLLADKIRQQRWGENIYYCSTQYIHPTNLCEYSCQFCSFYAKPGWKSAWFLSPQEIEEKVYKAYENGVIEIHIVGGLWKDCNLDYYQDVFTRIKKIDSKLHIKALTPVEYDYLARLHNLPIEEVLTRMRSWGLDSLPGGGAEILVEEVRQKIAPQKIDSEAFLEIHRLCHKLGITTNITMLFGHIEEDEHIIEHLRRVRALQDETGGFRSFVPLKYHEENNALGKRKNRLKPKDIQRIYAISSLFLDNFHRIKVLWNYVGIEKSIEILQAGANDIAATQQGESIITMAGGLRQSMQRKDLYNLICNLGRAPVHVHSGVESLVSK